MSNPYAPPPRGAGTGETPGPGRAPVPPQQVDPAGPGDAPPTQQPSRTGARGPTGARPPTDPEAARAASRRVMHFGLLMLATLLTTTLPLPWSVGALLFAVGAVVAGVLALRSVWKAGLRGALVPMLGLGIGFSVMMTTSLVAMIAMWPVHEARQDCLRDALTISARESCEAEYREQLQEQLEDALGG